MEYKIALRGVQSLGAGVTWVCYCWYQALFVDSFTLMSNQSIIHAASLLIAILTPKTFTKVTRLDFESLEYYIDSTSITRLHLYQFHKIPLISKCLQIFYHDNDEVLHLTLAL